MKVCLVSDWLMSSNVADTSDCGLMADKCCKTINRLIQRFYEDSYQNNQTLVGGACGTCNFSWSILLFGGRHICIVVHVVHMCVCGAWCLMVHVVHTIFITSYTFYNFCL